MATSQVLFWLRSEVKPHERRTPILPQHAKELIDAGHKIKVEKSALRCVPVSEYVSVGCEVVEEGTWKTAPKEAVILGLKELPEEDTPLTHNHIYFAHCFKNQGGWKDILNRFIKGEGCLYDLEFLRFENGRRVAAFGRSAGIVGAAVGLIGWAHKMAGTKLGAMTEPFATMDALADYTKALLEKAKEKCGRFPSVIVIGALGRCGTGSSDFCAKVGITTTKWDMAETKKGGPFKETIEHDVFINCIYLNPDATTPPFITKEMVNSKERVMRVMVDVSCDSSNPKNPVPIYTGGSTFDDPMISVIKESDDIKSLDVIAIDHLPSMIPSVSSGEFADDLLPHLKQYNTSSVWTGAKAIFEEKSKPLRS